MATTQVTITVNTPAGVTVASVVNTLCDYWGYQDTVNGQPNPQTKSQFVQAKIAQFLKDAYKAQKAALAAEAGRQTGLAEADQVTVS